MSEFFTSAETKFLKRLFDNYIDRMEHNPDREEMTILDGCYEKLTGEKLPPIPVIEDY